MSPKSVTWDSPEARHLPDVTEARDFELQNLDLLKLTLHLVPPPVQLHQSQVSQGFYLGSHYGRHIQAHVQPGRLYPKNGYFRWRVAQQLSRRQ